jgi:hypothetical protein
MKLSYKLAKDESFRDLVKCLPRATKLAILNTLQSREAPTFDR